MLSTANKMSREVANFWEKKENTSIVYTVSKIV